MAYISQIYKKNKKPITKITHNKTNPRESSRKTQKPPFPPPSVRVILKGKNANFCLVKLYREHQNQY
ncbi:hypothetical protein, partial [Flavobacterium sp.]|uniref:hypothetical protein n=1 Tax=Flavobacterium sp. TaxID=239 RepID=UPI00404849D6